MPPANAEVKNFVATAVTDLVAFCPINVGCLSCPSSFTRFFSSFGYNASAAEETGCSKHKL